jgi:hypothetical protein
MASIRHAYWQSVTDLLVPLFLNAMVQVLFGLSLAIIKILFKIDDEVLNITHALVLQHTIIMLH